MCESLVLLKEMQDLKIFICRISQDFNFTNQKMLGTSFFRNDVYNLKLPYPVKGIPPGRGLFLGFNLARIQAPIGFFYILDHVVPRQDYNGIKLYFHDPYDVISQQTIARHAKERTNIKFSVTPRVSTIHNSMINVHINK